MKLVGILALVIACVSAQSIIPGITVPPFSPVSTSPISTGPLPSAPSVPSVDTTATIRLIGDSAGKRDVCNGCEAAAETLRTEISNFLVISNAAVQVLDYEVDGTEFDALVEISDTVRNGATVDANVLVGELEDGLQQNDARLGPTLRQVAAFTVSLASGSSSVASIVSCSVAVAVFAVAAVL